MYDDIKIVATEATHRALDPQDLIPGDLFFVLVREDWRARDHIRPDGPMQNVWHIDSIWHLDSEAHQRVDFLKRRG